MTYPKQQTSAATIFCKTCGEEIYLPGQYLIIGRDKYHIGCTTPSGTADVVDGEAAAGTDK